MKKMFKKLAFQGLNYKDLDRFKEHDLKRDEMKSFYTTFDFIDLIRKWPEIVDPKMAKVTSPLKIKGDALIIVTVHSTYSHELSYFSEELKKNIFKALPELKPIIKKIVYETQENYFKERREVEAVKAAEAKPKLHPQSPQYKLLKAEADKLFGHIEDTELRSLMTSIFIQSNH
ncbi:MAG: DUF721 domain-containing protein [Bacteriovoracaceae bacterium]